MRRASTTHGFKDLDPEGSDTGRFCKLSKMRPGWKQVTGDRPCPLSASWLSGGEEALGYKFLPPHTWSQESREPLSQNKSSFKLLSRTCHGQVWKEVGAGSKASSILILKVYLPQQQEQNLHPIDHNGTP